MISPSSIHRITDPKSMKGSSFGVMRQQNQIREVKVPSRRNLKAIATRMGRQGTMRTRTKRTMMMRQETTF